MTVPRKARETFIAAIVRELPNLQFEEAMNLAYFLLRAEATLRRLNEARCSRPITDAEEDRAEKLRRRVQEACLERGLGMQFDYSPGSSAIWLLLPSSRTNDLDRKFYRVP